MNFIKYKSVNMNNIKNSTGFAANANNADLINYENACNALFTTFTISFPLKRLFFIIGSKENCHRFFSKDLHAMKTAQN